MVKKWRNTKHLESFIIGSIESDNIESFKHYITAYIEVKGEERFVTKFLNFSIEKNSVKCFKHLHEIGYKTASQDHILLRCCKINLIEDVYNLLKYHGYEFSINIKLNILKRILEPYKVQDNRERIDVAWGYIQSGFIEKEVFDNYIKFISSDNKESKYKNTIIGFIREFKLNQIL
jgi:hypothetical protein